MARPIYTQAQLELFSKEELKELVKDVAALCDDGREYPSGEKMFIDVHEGQRNSLKEQVHRILGNYLVQKQISMQGLETMEEADDFEIPDEDPDPISGFEIPDMIEEEPNYVSLARPDGDFVKEKDKMENSGPADRAGADPAVSDQQQIDRTASDSAAGLEKGDG